jgi:hypothetical protein
MTRSFPITAAGQSRYFTGFPLATPGSTGEPTQCHALYYKRLAQTNRTAFFSFGLV